MLNCSRSEKVDTKVRRAIVTRVIADARLDYLERVKNGGTHRQT